MSRHVADVLTPYLDGVLDSQRMLDVAAHLLACPTCRARHEELRQGRAALESLRVEVTPADAWMAIDEALDRGEGSRIARRRWPAILGIAAAVGAITLTTILLAPAGDGWNVTVLGGMPSIGSEAIGSAGQRLGEGEWLETDASSTARLTVGRIGHVQVDPGSRLRISRMPGLIDDLGEGSHRLELKRGTLHAVVAAPPRLFVVDMPAASAVDLGCAYSLVVLPSGDGRLTVTAGRVSLERDGSEAVVLAGAACEMRAASGPGTPYFLDARRDLVEALHRVDGAGAAGDAAALGRVIEAARPQDSLTLWHLLPRIDMGPRERVLARLEEMSPRPDGVTREGVLALDDRMLRRWRRELETAR